jgi:Flp pilus assembly protein TadG
MRSKSYSQKGASAVEFALVLPLLVVITFGIIEFGMFIYNQQVITNASREGARAGIVASAPRLTPAQIEAVVQNYCLNNMVTFGTPNTPRLDPNPPIGYQVPSSSKPNGAEFGDPPLQVRVTYDYSFLIIPNFIPGINKLQAMEAVTVMRYE